MLFGNLLCHVAISSTFAYAAPVSIMTSALKVSVTQASRVSEALASPTSIPLIQLREKFPIQDSFVYMDDQSKPVRGVVFIDDDGNLRVAIEVLEGQKINSTELLDQARSRNITSRINEPEPFALIHEDQKGFVPELQDVETDKPPEGQVSTILDDAKMAVNGTVYALAVISANPALSNANMTGCSPDCDHIKELEVKALKKHKKKQKKHKGKQGEEHDVEGTDNQDLKVHEEKHKKHKKEKKKDKKKHSDDEQNNQAGVHREQDGHNNNDPHGRNDHEGHHGHDGHDHHEDHHGRDDHLGHDGRHEHGDHDIHSGQATLEKGEKQAHQSDNGDHRGDGGHSDHEHSRDHPGHDDRLNKEQKPSSHNQESNEPKAWIPHNQTHAVTEHVGQVRSTPLERLVEPAPIKDAASTPTVGGSPITPQTL